MNWSNQIFLKKNLIILSIKVYKKHGRFQIRFIWSISNEGCFRTLETDLIKSLLVRSFGRIASWSLVCAQHKKNQQITRSMGIGYLNSLIDRLSDVIKWCNLATDCTHGVPEALTPKQHQRSIENTPKSSTRSSTIESIPNDHLHNLTNRPFKHFKIYICS